MSNKMTSAVEIVGVFCLKYLRLGYDLIIGLDHRETHIQARKGR